jgi:signal transduction histidine kinase
MGGTICYFVYTHVPIWQWAGWLTILIIVSSARFWIIKNTAKDKAIPISVRISIIALITLLAGITHSLSLLFFPQMSFAERSIQTLMHLGFAAGSIPSTGGYRPFHLSFTASTLLPLAFAWLVYPTPEVDGVMRLVIAAMVFSFFIFYMITAKNYFSFYEHSHRVSHQLSEAKGKLETANQRLEKALQEAVAASDSKTRFLAAASHDLRQPIHTLSLFGAALSMQQLDPKAQDICDGMSLSITNLANQMDGLLDISKLDAGVVNITKSDFDLAALVKQMTDEFEPIATENNIRIVFNSRHQQCITYSDPSLVSRLVQNLIANAIKYTDQGTVNISIAQADNQWRLSIADTGRGIADEDQGRIFDEFVQVGNRLNERTRGLGLGLAIVKRLCVLLDIDLSLDSELGKGTQFDLTLVRSESRVPLSLPIESDHVSIAKLDLLCIDNEESIRTALSMLLDEFGCCVRVCADVSSALTACNERVPDIVIADLHLDHGETGIDVIHSIRNRHGELPAIIISGETDASIVKSVKEEKIPLLNKPLSAEKLKRVIAKLANIN